MLPGGPAGSNRYPWPHFRTSRYGAPAVRGFVRLAWLPGETGHLLDAVALLPARAAELFPWLDRPSVAAQAAALRDLLLGERLRFATAPAGAS